MFATAAAPKVCSNKDDIDNSGYPNLRGLIKKVKVFLSRLKHRKFFTFF